MTTDLSKRFEADNRCRKCGGTGRRGRGRCRECEGKGEAAFGPRVHFNWGYHDGARDHAAGRPRAITDGFRHDLETVSRARHFWYASGYEAGLAAAAAGAYAGNSKSAWERFMGAGHRAA